MYIMNRKGVQHMLYVKNDGGAYPLIHDFSKEIEYLESQINSLNSTLFNKIFPIGSIYISINSTNPSEYFGGTWSRWGSGRVPVGVDSTQSEFNYTEKMGGTKIVDLSHSHTVNSHSHSLESGWAKIGRCRNYMEGIAYKTGPGAASTTYDRAQTNGGGIAGGLFTATDTAALGGDTSSTSPGTSNGLSNRQSILQPYVTCYMWKRIA